MEYTFRLSATHKNKQHLKIRMITFSHKNKFMLIIKEQSYRLKIYYNYSPQIFANVSYPASMSYEPQIQYLYLIHRSYKINAPAQLSLKNHTSFPA